MSKTVTLLRPFTFSRPAIQERNHLLSEVKFAPQRTKDGQWIPTEVEIDDDVAEHPFIAKHFADGCIERPEVTAARLKAIQEKANMENAHATQELKRAEDALKRASGAHAVHQVNENDVAKQLNTPVNQLGAQQGKDVEKPVDEKAKK